METVQDHDRAPLLPGVRVHGLGGAARSAAGVHTPVSEAARMAGGGAASSAACSRARVLKLLLVVLGAVVFLEYVSGLLMEGGRTLTLYASNSSTIRNSQGLPWPKRTHGRHCFDDHVSGPGTQPEPFSASNTTPTFLPPTRMPANLTSDERSPVVNVHNSTLRAKVFIDEKNSSQSDADGVANRTTVLGDLNTNNSWTTLMSDEAISTESPEAGCEFPCPAFPPGLEGPIAANLTDINLKDLEFSHLDVEEGGRFAPRTCKPKYKVAIIIPYRDRESHLAIFLNNIHPFLMKQQIDYQIFIVEQKGSAKFNRATLMNVGFVESMRLRAWDCFVFHDVDLIPLDDRNLYTCPQQPRHLSAAIDKFEFKLPYRTIFGGVSSLTTQQFKKVNGFSNSFWGWGGEDDDMASRIVYHQFHISRYPMSIARYTMLDHEKEKPNQERYNVLIKGKQLYNTDGLNNLHYKLVETRMHALYTQLMVELQPPS